MTRNQKTSRTEHFDEGRRDWQRMETRRRESSINKNYMATQAGCRDYWRHMYGAEAERASRGGVDWLGV